MTLTEYPNYIQERMRTLQSRTSMSIDEIISEYMETFEKSEVQARAQFPSASPADLIAIREKFAIGSIWNNLITRAPQSEMQIIYCGHGGLRYKQGTMKPYNNMFAVVQEDKVARIVRMVANGIQADIYRSLSFFTRYTASLGRFDKTGDLIVDNRTEFKAGVAVNLDIDRFNDLLKIPVISVDQAVNNPSKKKGNWTDSADWRCIKGFVGGDPRSWTDKKDKKTQRGVCNITDMTVDEQPTVDDSGNIISPGLTGWSPPEHLIVNDGDFCAFYGSIGTSVDEKSGEKNASMNICLIRPIFVTAVDIEDDI